MHPCAGSHLDSGDSLVRVFLKLRDLYPSLGTFETEGIMTVGTLTPWSVCRLMFFAAYRAVSKAPKSFVVPWSCCCAFVLSCSLPACQECDILHDVLAARSCLRPSLSHSCRGARALEVLLRSASATAITAG